MPVETERARELADGNLIPLLGSACGKSKTAGKVWMPFDGRSNSVYRHIDTAQVYGNEDVVGQGLRESGVPREDVGTG